MEPAIATQLALAPPPTARHWSIPLGERLRPFWPWLAAVLLLLGLIASAVGQIKEREGGHFVYTVDDGYFHMAVAKNLLRHHIWGISAIDGFSSGTSSLLWPPIIAVCFAAFGFHEYFPFVLNALASVAMLGYAAWIIRRTTGSNVLSFLVLTAIVLLMPVLAVAATGMEHCLQTLLCVVFVDLAARLLTADAQRLRSKVLAPVALCLVATLMVMTRYEGLFLVAPVGLFLLCQRRLGLAVWLGIAAGTPVIAFGLYCVSKGWYFLPNSLLIKGNSHFSLNPVALYFFLQKWYITMLGDLHLVALLAVLTAAVVASLQRARTLWTYPALFLSITLIASLQHLQFAGIGWFYRYEAYLIVLTLLGVGVALGYEAVGMDWRYWLSARAVPHWAALGFAAILFGSPLWARGIESIPHTVNASYNIYEQQYQMGHFVRQFYDGKAVAANDMGAITYFGEISTLDVVGLADIDVLRARRATLWGNYDWKTLQRLCDKRHVELVMVYDNWNTLYGGQLPEWVLVGQWQIQHNTVVGGDTVSFYAPHADQVPELTRHLKEFGKTLPKDIIQRGIYCGEQSPQIAGTFGLEGDPKDALYWSPAWARFTVFPPEGTPLDSDETTLRLSILPVSKGLTMEVYFNDHLVENRKIPVGSLKGWVTFDIKAKWHEGANTVRLIGHGTAVKPKHDPRSLLFRVLDPRKMMDEEGKVVSQLEPEESADAPDSGSENP